MKMNLKRSAIVAISLALLSAAFLFGINCGRKYELCLSSYSHQKLCRVGMAKIDSGDIVSLKSELSIIGRAATQHIEKTENSIVGKLAKRKIVPSELPLEDLFHNQHQ